METIIQALIWIGIGIAVIVVIVSVTGSRSISRYLLTKDIVDTVEKTMPGALVADAAASSHDEIEVEFMGREGKMKVYRRSGLMIGVFTDDSGSIPKTGTFRFLAPRAIPDDPRIDASAVDQRFRAAFTTIIAEKGFMPADSMEADVLVTYHLALEGPVDDAQIGDNYGYHIPEMISNRGDIAAGQATLLERATLIIDFIDPSGKKLIWRASLLTNIVVEVSADERLRRTSNAIETMLTFFPPKTST